MTLTRRHLFALAATASATPALAAADDDDAATVQRQTSELNDAITHGRPNVWLQYLHDACIYTDEEGAVSTKTEMVSQIRPLPPGVSGNLSLVDYQTHRAGDTLIGTYIIDE